VVIDGKLDGSRFKKRVAPSRHSGLSSLSPNEPKSSLTTMSTFSGSSMNRISPKTNLTFAPHSRSCRLCKLNTQSGIAEMNYYRMNLRDERVWVFLDNIYKSLSARFLDCCQAPSYNGTSAGTCNAKDTMSKGNNQKMSVTRW
jgi:hypothetical protein